MRFDRDQLIFKALCALDEAVDACDTAPVKPTFALRFAMAFLFAVSDGERECYDGFWKEISREQSPAHAESVANYIRTTHARSRLSAIARGVGYELTADLMERLRSARVPPRPRPGL